MKIPSPVKPYLDTIKLVLAVAVGCALLWGGQKILAWRDAAQHSEQQKLTATATVGIIEDGDKADEERATTDEGVAQGREDFNTNYQEAVTHEPETATRADRTVPASVRNAFRERRLARERLGCAGEQCGSGSEEETSSER